MTGHKLIVSSPKMGGFQLGLKFVSVSLPIAKTGQGMLWDKRTTDQSQTSITNTLKCVRRDPLETKGFNKLLKCIIVFLLHLKSNWKYWRITKTNIAIVVTFVEWVLWEWIPLECWERLEPKLQLEDARQKTEAQRQKTHSGGPKHERKKNHLITKKFIILENIYIFVFMTFELTCAASFNLDPGEPNNDDWFAEQRNIGLTVNWRMLLQKVIAQEFRFELNRSKVWKPRLQDIKTTM